MKGEKIVLGMVRDGKRQGVQQVFARPRRGGSEAAQGAGTFGGDGREQGAA